MKIKYRIPLYILFSIALLSSLVGNAVLIYTLNNSTQPHVITKIEAQNSGTQSCDVPQIILNQADRIKTNNDYFEASGYSLSDYTIFFSTSQQLNENVARYVLYDMRKEEKKTEPMVYMKINDTSDFIVAFQNKENEFITIQLNIDANGTVSEIERNFCDITNLS